MNHAGNILHVSAEFLLRTYQCMIIKIVVMDFICINLASFSFILFILGLSQNDCHLLFIDKSKGFMEKPRLVR